MPRTAPREKKKLEVTIGIDVGSVSTRACIWCPSTDVEIPVSNPSRLQTLLTSTRFEKGDFSSSCYPFDDNGGPVYLGLDTPPDPERARTSLKFAPYILVNCTDVLLKQYLLLNSLMEKRHDMAFHARLRRGLEELFSTVASRVDQICKAKGLIVADIALTVPSQWTLEFEDLYSDIVGKVFDRPHSAIYFCTETEALANFVLRDHLNDLDQHGAYSTKLFMDWGGHNMNGCIFEVATGNDGETSFYRAGQPFGAGGGSEHWEYNIGRLCTPLLESQHKISMGPKRKQAILDDFTRYKLQLGPGRANEDTVLVLRENKKIWEIVLDKETVDQAWEEAHQRPLKLAATCIAEFSVFTSSKGRVVVSGGTGRHPALRERLTSMCREASLPDPFFTDDLDPTYDTVKIAKGAAYAVGGRITTEEFFRRGASIGLQIKEGTDNVQELWSDTAGFLTSFNRKKAQGIPREYGAVELQLLCDPFFSTSKDQDNLHYTRCYNLLFLGKFTRGEWSFSAKLEGQENDMVLVLERSRKVRTRNRRLRFRKRPPGWNQPFRWQLVETYRLPLYFDPGANCVHVGERGRDVRELELGLPVQEQEEMGQVNCTGGEGSSADEESLEPAQLPQMQVEYASGCMMAEKRPRGAKPSRNLERFDPLEKRKTPSWKGT